MANRSSEHMSTQFTPNMPMLERETTLPLDLQYGMPEHMNEETPNEWVWILRERPERAYSVVRQQIEDAMNWQKKYHDMNMSRKSLRKMKYLCTNLREKLVATQNSSRFGENHLRCLNRGLMKCMR